VEPEWNIEIVMRRKNGFVTTCDLLDFALQIVNGMDFLHGKGVYFYISAVRENAL
jgi:hypothetical protein